jgi:hypothetical protein
MLRSGNTLSNANKLWLNIFIKLDYPHVLCILMALWSNFAKLHAKGLRNLFSVGQNGPNLNANKLK